MSFFDKLRENQSISNKNTQNNKIQEFLDNGGKITFIPANKDIIKNHSHKTRFHYKDLYPTQGFNDPISHKALKIRQSWKKPEK